MDEQGFFGVVTMHDGDEVIAWMHLPDSGPREVTVPTCLFEDGPPDPFTQFRYHCDDEYPDGCVEIVTNREILDALGIDRKEWIRWVEDLCPDDG